MLILYGAAPVIVVVLAVVHLFQVGGIGTTSPFGALIEALAKEAVPLALVSLGASLVISMGAVDLSSMGNATLSAVVGAAVLQSTGSPTQAIMAGVICGTVIGLAVAQLTVWGSPPLLASWSIGSLGFVLAMTICAKGMFGLAPNVQRAEFPRRGTWLALWDGPNAHGETFSFLLLLVVLVLLGLSTLPAKTRAIGAHRESAVLSGVRTKVVTRMAFGIAGALSACYGLLQASKLGTAPTGELFGRELAGVSVAVLGGTLLSGGYYSSMSIVCAAGLWTMIASLITSSRLSYFSASDQQRVIDAAFAVAVLGFSSLVGALLKRDITTILVDTKVEE